MSDQYQRYKNICVFAERRGYERISELKDGNIFKKEMQNDQYVRLEYLNKKNGKPVLIYLFAKGSKYTEQSQQLKKILSKIKNPSDVILISEFPLKSYSIKAISIFKHLRVKKYLHDNFSLIIPEGPMCHPHIIMSREEVIELLNNQLNCTLFNLPKILDEDPQCIWIGAEVGDVVKIIMKSNINGEHIQYRTVVSNTGRLISFRDDIKTNEEDVEDVDEEPIEIEDLQDDDLD